MDNSDSDDDEVMFSDDSQQCMIDALEIQVQELTF